MKRQQEVRTALAGKDGKATGRKYSVSGKRWKGNKKEGHAVLLEKMENNRKEGHCYWEKMERQQEGMNVLLKKDGKATGRKDSITGKKYGQAKGRKDSIIGKRWEGNRK